jgi:hypothetical protein
VVERLFTRHLSEKKGGSREEEDTRDQGSAKEMIGFHGQACVLKEPMESPETPP